VRWSLLRAALIPAVVTGAASGAIVGAFSGVVSSLPLFQCACIGGVGAAMGMTAGTLWAMVVSNFQ
jgi:hypothetical protein